MLFFTVLYTKMHENGGIFTFFIFNMSAEKPNGSGYYFLLSYKNADFFLFFLIETAMGAGFRLKNVIFSLKTNKQRKMGLGFPVRGGTHRGWVKNLIPGPSPGEKGAYGGDW